MKIWKILLSLLLASVATAATIGAPMKKSINQVDKKIDNPIPICYIGKDVAKHFTRVIELKKPRIVHERHILLVDGGYAKKMKLKAFLKAEIFAGTPVIVVNGTDVIKNLFKGQFCPEVVAGRTPDGKPIGKEIVYGYIVYPINNKTLVTKVFISTDPSFEAIFEAYRWASDNMPDTPIKIKSTLPYWNQIYQLDYTTGDSWKPYGRLNIRTLYYKLYNDNSGTYDWYDVHVRQQSVPGEELWSSGWKTADMYTWIDADYYKSDYFLSDYTPTTTLGTTTVSVSIGVSAGNGAQVSTSQSWSYTIPDVVIHDQSDYSKELAKWWHDVDESKAVGSNTYQIEPGATIRVPNGAPMDWKEHYGVRYAKWYVLWWSFAPESWVEFRI